jgi:tRNA-Thr(GGU) m(6)t(6)A37 methyltransferase TsaA
VAKIEYQPIGIFRCAQNQPTDSPRQGVLAQDSQGVLELRSQFAGDSLKDLEGFSHIWLIYAFHENNTWKPMVLPPRGGNKKRGVFATRSPYRPNNIGMSLVQLEKIEGYKVYCNYHDLLDGTPILDIKPYLHYSDSVDEASSGWTADTKEHEVGFSDQAVEKISWLSEKMGKSLLDICRNQLKFDPTDSQKKRVKSIGEAYCLSYRTWRFDFKKQDLKIEIFDLRSGYTAAELLSQDDPYEDKDLHQQFLKSFR